MQNVLTHADVLLQLSVFRSFYPLGSMKIVVTYESSTASERLLFHASLTSHPLCLKSFIRY